MPDLPFDEGDVIVLEGGRGLELWLSRRMDLRAEDGDPFLILFSCDGREAERGLVSLDPLRPDEVGVLQTKLPPIAGEPPSSLEVGGHVLRRVYRRGVAGGGFAAAYADDLSGRAIVVCLQGKTLGYAGRAEKSSGVSIMRAK